jgi:hypothetical protein
MAWQRESEFRQLLSANIKHLTKDGLDELVAIAVKDMAVVRCLLCRQPVGRRSGHLRVPPCRRRATLKACASPRRYSFSMHAAVAET